MTVKDFVDVWNDDTTEIVIFNQDQEEVERIFSDEQGEYMDTADWEIESVYYGDYLREIFVYTYCPNTLDKFGIDDIPTYTVLHNRETDLPEIIAIGKKKEGNR